MLGHCQCNPGFSGDDCSDSEFHLLQLLLRNFVLFLLFIFLETSPYDIGTLQIYIYIYIYTSIFAYSYRSLTFLLFFFCF